ncbi:MAG: peptidylprolyl isomerase [Acidimicrobiales bacterium]
MKHPLVSGGLAVLILVGGIVAAGSFSVPANALSVDGQSISRAALNSDLATIEHNPAFGCYLDASVEVRSQSEASLPAIAGQTSSGAYNTQFVDFWLSQVINNLLIEHLAEEQHLAIDSTALAAGRQDLNNSISATLEDAAASSGQSAVCAASGQAIVRTLPSGLVEELVRAQAAGDQVLARAAGYGLGTIELSRYFATHASQFQTVCLSAIEVSSQATATSVRQGIESGAESFAAAAKADSTDTSASNGGALGCYSANEGAYETVVSDVSGLSVGEISQPISDNGSYLLLEPTSYLPATFDDVVPAVRQAVLGDGSAKASKELAALTKTARVSVDPRYGIWDGASGVGIESPKTPPSSDLLHPGE